VSFKIVPAVKQTCAKRPDFKLIIMSATIDVQIFSNYFKSMKFINVNISGETNHPIKHIYVPDKINRYKYIEKGLELINEILTSTKTGDILFFVPSIADTFAGCKRITDATNYCVEVYSGLDAENELLATNLDMYKSKYPGKIRKVVIATNVAESSLTIDGIKYVVDSGYEIFSYFDPLIESMVLDKRLTTKAQIKQRCGRTGRTAPGSCYHMYTENDYGGLEEYPKPAIQTSDVTSECLALLVWDNIQTITRLKNVLMEFIEPPTKPYIDHMIRTLTELELVRNDQITELGKLVASLPMEPVQGVAVCGGWKLGCSGEVIDLIVITTTIKNNIDKLFNFNKNETDKNKIKRFNMAKNSLMKKNSDHMTIISLYKKYKKLKKISADELNVWMKKYYLNKKIFDTIDVYSRKMRNDCVDKLRKYFGSDQQNTTERLKLRIGASLFKGYRIHTAILTKYGYVHGQMIGGKISSESWLHGKQKKKIMYSELFTTSGKTFLQINTNVSKKMRVLADSIKL